MTRDPPQTQHFTVSGAARGAVAGAVAHLDPLAAHLQQRRVRNAGLTGVSEALLVMAAVVRDVHWSPRGPRSGLLQLRARKSVA